MEKCADNDGGDLTGNCAENHADGHKGNRANNQDGFNGFHRKLGARMQKLRKEHGLSQEKLAELLDIDRTSVGYYEQGRRAPSLQVLYKMADTLDIEVNDFFA